MHEKVEPKGEMCKMIDKKFYDKNGKLKIPNSINEQIEAFSYLGDYGRQRDLLKETFKKSTSHKKEEDKEDNESE